MAAVSRLACHDLLDDTVIVFSSDSGFKLGSHNMAQVGVAGALRWGARGRSGLGLLDTAK